MNLATLLNVGGGFLIGYYIAKHYFVTGGKMA